MCFIDYKKAFDCVDHEDVDHPEGHGGAYTFSSATEKNVCKPESDSQNRVRRDGTVRYRERCETGLHPVSFAIQHIRREYNEMSVTNGRAGSA